MYSIYGSLGAAAAASLAAWQLSHRWWVGLIAGVVAMAAVFGSISYWVRQQLNRRMPAIEQAVQGQRVEQALKLLEELRPLRPLAAGTERGRRRADRRDHVRHEDGLRSRAAVPRRRS
ncbi:MAG: hypothetical protein U0470_09005 [Anaerolineae bacterium]